MDQYIEDLKLNRLGRHPSEMMEDRELWRLNFVLLPRNPHRKACNEERSKQAALWLNIPSFRQTGKT